MNTTQSRAPGPIVREYGMRSGYGEEITIDLPARGDHFNLTTGECSVARIIGGIRFDTNRAVLIAGFGGPTEIGGYRLRRLYRGCPCGFFQLRMHWADNEGFSGPDFIEPVTDTEVLTVARRIIHSQDCLPFLRNWYCAGWIPRDDAAAQKWAEITLGADDCEALLAEIAQAQKYA